MDIIDILLGIGAALSGGICLVVGYIQVSQAIEKYKRNK